MLVLSRRVGESIMIGPDVTVTVLEVRPDLVRIGIDAPRDVQVHREEVFVEVQQANRSAASPSAQSVEALAAGLRGGAEQSADHAVAGNPVGSRPVKPGRQNDATRPKPKPPGSSADS